MTSLAPAVGKSTGIKSREIPVWSPSSDSQRIPASACLQDPGVNLPAPRGCGQTACTRQTYVGCCIKAEYLYVQALAWRLILEVFPLRGTENLSFNMLSKV